jgi:sulfonate transport system substrate-binding protein
VTPARANNGLGRTWTARLILLMAVGLCGCTQSADKPPKIVRIGYQKAGTLNLLRLRGQLEPDMERLGLRVQWVGFPAVKLTTRISN